MASSLRKDVLKAFKSLHRARTIVFEGDDYALKVARQKINEEYQKNKHIQIGEEIKKLLMISKEAEEELRTNVVQAKLVEPGKYELRIREETTKLDNFPYQDVPEDVLKANKKRALKKSSSKDNNT